MISIVLPTYNERENIARLIPEIEKQFSRKKITIEILVVDDDSPDGTAAVAKELNKMYRNIRVISRTKKEGIGAALRHGYDEARGEVIISSDADLAFKVEDMLKLLERIQKGSDLIVGSRHLKTVSYEKTAIGTKIKWIVSYFGNKMIRVISGVAQVHDFSANFRAIRKPVWNCLKTHENSNALLFEMILKAQCKGYRVEELSVTFKDRIYGKSKLNLAKEAPSFFLKLLWLSIKVRLFRKE